MARPQPLSLRSALRQPRPSCSRPPCCADTEDEEDEVEEEEEEGGGLPDGKASGESSAEDDIITGAAARASVASAPSSTVGERMAQRGRGRLVMGRAAAPGAAGSGRGGSMGSNVA